MKTATKSSWSKVAQDLCGRWFVREYVQREKAAEKETNKHKNGSLSPVRSSYFLPNLRLTISKFSNFSSKMLSNLRDTRENTRSCSVEIFCTLPKTIETTQVAISQQKKKKCWELLDLAALTSSPSWMETSFAPAFCNKGWDGRESRHRGQCLMATSPAFPSGLHVSKR